MAANALPVDRAALVKRLETICTAACSGDTEAVAKVKQIKEAALAGDPRAKLALAGLRHLYWRKQEDTVAWNAAEAIYRQTAKGDAKAKLVVKGIIARAKAGDRTARGAWARMKAIHGSTQPGALFPNGPGQARMGGYGMPARNRAGVIVGGVSGPNLVGGRPIGVGGVSGPNLVGGARPIGMGGYGNASYGDGLGAPARNYAQRLVGGPTLVGGYGNASYGDGLGVPARNYAQRLVGGYGAASYGDGLGATARNYADRLVGGRAHRAPVLVSGRHIVGEDHERASMRSAALGTVGGTELMGGYGLPVRARSGLVVGRSHVAFGGALTAPQISDLKSVMQRALSTRVALIPRTVAKAMPLTPEFQTRQAGQKKLGLHVLDARLRRSQALPSLIRTLQEVRTRNLLSGFYITDADFESTDAYEWHKPLKEAGEEALAAIPVLRDVQMAIPDPDPADPARLQRRRDGFKIAMGIRRGQVEAGFPAWIMQSLRESEARAGVPSDTFYGLALGLGANEFLFHTVLDKAGDAAIARNPVLAQKAASLPNDGTRRGFVIAAGIRELRAVPQYAMFVRQALLSSPPTVAGFDAGMSMP